MKQRYQPQTTSSPALSNYDFSMKSLGRSSSADIGFEDVVEVSLTFLVARWHAKQRITIGKTHVRTWITHTKPPT
jgi:hypothetical protein